MTSRYMPWYDFRWATKTIQSSIWIFWGLEFWDWGVRGLGVISLHTLRSSRDDAKKNGNWTHPLSFCLSTCFSLSVYLSQSFSTSIHYTISLASHTWCSINNHPQGVTMVTGSTGYLLGVWDFKVSYFTLLEWWLCMISSSNLIYIMMLVLMLMNSNGLYFWGEK